MREIKDFASDMKDELADAKKYARRALAFKDLDPEAAQEYYDLSTEELGHKDRLHKLAVRYIKKAGESGSPLVPGMKARYEDEHGELIEKEKEIRILLDMFRG